MNAHSDQGNHLTDDVAWEAAADLPLAPAASEHLAQCAGCRARVNQLRAALTTGRSAHNATIDQAVASFRMPRLPERARPARTSVWSLFATPIPAYAAAALLLVLLLPAVVVMQRHPGMEVGSMKDVTLQPTGQATQATLETFWTPNLQQPERIKVSIGVIESLARTHPDDLSIHVKLVELYRALLRQHGWEDATHTVANARQRLADEEAAVARLMPKFLSKEVAP